MTILLALFGTTFILQAFKIPSQSMEPTLLVGDHLLVNKFMFGGRGAWYEKLLPYRPVRRGDIIVFKFPFDDHPHYVKRVIGLPGDRIRIVNEQVFVNGRSCRSHTSSTTLHPTIPSPTTFRLPIAPSRDSGCVRMVGANHQLCSERRVNRAGRSLFRDGG